MNENFKVYIRHSAPIWSCCFALCNSLSQQIISQSRVCIKYFNSKGICCAIWHEFPVTDCNFKIMYSVGELWSSWSDVYEKHHIFYCEWGVDVCVSLSNFSIWEEVKIDQMKRNQRERIRGRREVLVISNVTLDSLPHKICPEIRWVS